MYQHTGIWRPRKTLDYMASHMAKQEYIALSGYIGSKRLE